MTTLAGLIGVNQTRSRADRVAQATLITVIAATAIAGVPSQKRRPLPQFYVNGTLAATAAIETGGTCLSQCAAYSVILEFRSPIRHHELVARKNNAVYTTVPVPFAS